MSKKSQSLPVYAQAPRFGGNKRSFQHETELDSIFAKREAEMRQGKAKDGRQTTPPSPSGFSNWLDDKPKEQSKQEGKAKFEPFDTSRQARCYSGGASLCAEATLPSRPIDATIKLDIAPKEDKSRPADWSEKITFLLSPNQLTELAALLLGFTSKILVKQKDKSVEVERSAGHIYFRATEAPGKTAIIAVPVLDAFRLSTLVLDQLQRSTQSQDQQGMIAALRGVYALNS